MIRKFLAYPRRERALLGEALAYLGLARALLLLPFQWVAPLLGRQVPGEAVPPPAMSIPPQEAREIGQAIERASAHTPWKSACLAQAVAGKLMLKRRRIPSRLHLGMRRDEAGKLQAHAWLESGNEVLVGGGEKQKDFGVLAVFVE